MASLGRTGETSLFSYVNVLVNVNVPEVKYHVFLVRLLSRVKVQTPLLIVFPWLP